MSGPTLLNMPQPPSEPVTPSEAGPGTPNSDRTSMSELSTVAIKDGHRGHPHSHHLGPHAGLNDHRSADQDQRNDRISRLPGLERLTQQRQLSNSSIPPGGSASHPQGYFEREMVPPSGKDRSTVGSASATGSVGGRTTWAEGSEPTDTTDKMSMSGDMSDGGVSDENASLVGFGEGASSTMSGPISSMTPGATRSSQRQRMSALGKVAGMEPTRDARMEGVNYDGEERMESTPPAMEKLDSEDVHMTEPAERRDGSKELGRVGFEDSK